MPGRRLPTVDIRTLLLHIRSNPSDRAVSRDTGLDRRTVRSYRHWAQQQKLLTEPLLSLEELQQRREEIRRTSRVSTLRAVDRFRRHIRAILSEPYDPDNDPDNDPENEDSSDRDRAIVHDRHPTPSGTRDALTRA